MPPTEWLVYSYSDGSTNIFTTAKYFLWDKRTKGHRLMCFKSGQHRVGGMSQWSRALVLPEDLYVCFPATMWQLTTVSISNSRVSDTLSCPLRAPSTYVAHCHLFRQNTNNKINLKVTTQSCLFLIHSQKIYSLVISTLMKREYDEFDTS